MANKLSKTQLIDKIIKKHPHYGLGLNLSWYVGGMADTGEWYISKLLNMQKHKLQELYDYIQHVEKQVDTPKVANGKSFDVMFKDFNNKVHAEFLQNILGKIA